MLDRNAHYGVCDRRTSAGMPGRRSVSPFRISRWRAASWSVREPPSGLRARRTFSRAMNIRSSAIERIVGPWMGGVNGISWARPDQTLGVQIIAQQRFFVVCSPYMPEPYGSPGRRQDRVAGCYPGKCRVQRSPGATDRSTGNQSLPSILAPQLRVALLRLSNKESAKHHARRALRGLAGFARALKVKYQDIEVGLDADPEPGLADNGDLEKRSAGLVRGCGFRRQGGRKLFGSLCRRTPIRERGAVGGIDYRVAPRLSAASPVGDARCRLTPGPWSHGKGKVVRREAFRVS